MQNAPQLPAGYGSMLLLAMIPPLWRKVMDPLVLAHYNGDGKPLRRYEVAVDEPDDDGTMRIRLEVSPRLRAADAEVADLMTLTTHIRHEASAGHPGSGDAPALPGPDADHPADDTTAAHPGGADA